MELKAVRHQMVVNVQLDDFVEKEGWPNMAAYAYNRSGDFLGMEEIKQDLKRPGTGKASIKISSRRETVLVKVGPVLENERLLGRYQPVTQNVTLKEGLEVTFMLKKKIWICWLKIPYYVTGTVKKHKVGQDLPICAGEVTIYDVDIKYCLLRLPDIVIERLREAIIDVVIDPPPIDPSIIDFQKPQMWWDWDDDDWCGTKPRPPFPPPRIDILRKLESLPQQWAFAKQRYEALGTARERISEKLSSLSLDEKSVFFNREIAEGITLSKVIYSNTAQFRTLLIEKFPLIRFWLCWWPWIYWIWWPHCGYSLEKLGTAELQPDGSFAATVWLSICRKDTPDLWFEVRQNIDGVERVIYARYPVPCNTYWNHPSGDPVHLLVTDPNAVACQQHIPGIADAYVMPMGIYEDEWYQVDQAHIKSAVVPITPLPAACGLYNSTDPYGTRLDLRMQFHDDLRDILPPNNGARFYRWSYRLHGQTDWIPIDTPISHRYIMAVSPGHSIQSERLGPNKVGTENNLFAVPEPDKNWLDNRDDLAYAIWHTAVWDGSKYVQQIPNGQYDLRLEMFDKNGVKLTPAAAGFKFTLATAFLGPIDDALFVESDGSLIMHLYIDNSDTIADIKSVALNGVKAGDCQFLTYSDKINDTVDIEVTAYHPTITPNFLKSYHLNVARGISGTSVGKVDPDPTTPALPVPPAASPTVHSFTVGTLLGTYDQCSFSIWLHTYPRTRDGHSAIRAYEGSDTSAFALVIKPAL